jgi:hypothetical protein
MSAVLVSSDADCISTYAGRHLLAAGRAKTLAALAAAKGLAPSDVLRPTRPALRPEVSTVLYVSQHNWGCTFHVDMSNAATVASPTKRAPRMAEGTVYTKEPHRWSTAFG